VDDFEYAHAGKPDCYEVFKPAESLTDWHYGKPCCYA
jgi:hypothetical protein